MRIAIASLLLSMALRLGVAVETAPAAAQTFTEFILPTPASRPSGITTGPDDALWFTEGVGGKIGRITTTGMVTEFTIPTPMAKTGEITTGPDGALWFTYFRAKIARITATGAVTEFTIPTENGSPG